MINKLYVDKNAELSVDEIIELVINFDSSSDLARLINLEKYFQTKNTNITQRTLDGGRDNSKLLSGFCRYITNTINGYFMNGKDSVTYVYPEEMDVPDIEKLFRYNDEPAVNNKIGENMSVYGYAIEQIYIESNNKFRFAAINPKNVILLFEDNVDEDIHSVIKYRSTYLEDEKYTRYVVDYYTKNRVCTYIFKDSMIIPEYTEELINPFGDVPFIYYENSNEMGDFESVISLVDAYDRTLSDMSNLFDYFNDAYLVFTGAELENSYDDYGNEVSPMDTMKSNRCFTLPQGATAQFLAKPNFSQDSISFATKLKEDIHKFSHVPDNSDERFIGSSGVALEYKLQPLEYLCAIKESKFRKGLTRRLELLGNYLSLKNEVFDVSEISIVFKRNTVSDIASTYDTILKLRGVISDRSLLDKLPGVDADVEEERLQEQKERNIEEFNLPINNEPINNQDEEEQGIE